MLMAATRSEALEVVLASPNKYCSLISFFSIRNIRVTKSVRIFTSRYRLENRKCWSQIALAPMGEKRFPSPSS